jgi:hypothetical protein
MKFVFGGARAGKSENLFTSPPDEIYWLRLPMWRNWQTRQTQNHRKSLGIKRKYLDYNGLTCPTKISKRTCLDSFGPLFKRAGYNPGYNG